MHFIAVFFSIRGISGDDLIRPVAYSQTCLLLLVYFIMFPIPLAVFPHSFFFVCGCAFACFRVLYVVRFFFSSFSLNFRLPLLFSFLCFSNEVLRANAILHCTDVSAGIFAGGSFRLNDIAAVVALISFCYCFFVFCYGNFSFFFH